MKVVYLDHTAKLSGGEIALLRLLPHLDEVEPTVILGEDGPLVQKLRGAGIATLVLPISDLAKDFRKESVVPGRDLLHPALSTLRYAVLLARVLRRLQPDLVHANSLKSGIYGCVAASLARVPLVWHVRDRISADYLPSRAVWAMRAIIRNVPDAVLANSVATMSTLRGTDSIVVSSVIPDLSGDGHGEHERRTGPAEVFGMVGRIAPWKGQDVFLRAFKAAFPFGSERAVFVGEAMFGETEYYAWLRKLASELGLADRVEFCGFRENVSAELARFDVLVHASISEEPFGQVILEGLAAGLPVTASAGGGPSEIISDGHDGLLHTPGDVDALAAQLARLRSDDELRARLGDAGIRRAQDFRPEVARDLVQSTYRRLLA